MAQFLLQPTSEIVFTKHCICWEDWIFDFTMKAVQLGTDPNKMTSHVPELQILTSGTE